MTEERTEPELNQANVAPRVFVGKVPFAVASSMNDAVDRILKAADRSEPISVRLSNAYCVALASRDENYATLLNNNGINFPDGTPVVWFMKAAAKARKPSRVRGPSLFVATLAKTRTGEYGHFFLGTTNDTLNLLTEKVQASHPDLKISGMHSPPFAPLDDDYFGACAEKIRQTDADLIWVALGTPKQDFVADELAKRLNRPCVAVGAAFDFVAGTVQEAPLWIQNSGFEWLYRLCSEPRRLWKRYLIGNLQFLRTALLEHKKSARDASLNR